MKKIKGGKVYDTQTAEKVGSWDNGQAGDFSHYAETLYRKRTGEFFLYGVGGAASKYAVSCGDSNWTGGEQIIPLSYASAQKWAEDHLGGDEYEAIFGQVEEGEGKAVVYLYLSTSKIEGYRRAAAQAGKSLTAYIEGLLDKASEE